MFSSFLSSRDSDAEDQPPLESELSKRNNFKPLSQKVV